MKGNYFHTRKQIVAGTRLRSDCSTCSLRCCKDHDLKINVQELALSNMGTVMIDGPFDQLTDGTLGRLSRLRKHEFSCGYGTHMARLTYAKLLLNRRRDRLKTCSSYYSRSN